MSLLIEQFYVIATNKKGDRHKVVGGPYSAEANARAVLYYWMEQHQWRHHTLRICTLTNSFDPIN